MSVHSEIIGFVQQARAEIKKTPFLYFAGSYGGLRKEIELKRTNINTALSLLRLEQFWLDRVKQLKNNPEPTPEKQAEQEKDRQKITSCCYNILVDVIEPIRERRYAEIKTSPLTEMEELMKEFAKRYGE